MMIFNQQSLTKPGRIILNTSSWNVPKNIRAFRPIWSRISIYSWFHCANGNNCHISRAIRACIHLNSSQQKILFQKFVLAGFGEMNYSETFRLQFFSQIIEKAVQKNNKMWKFNGKLYFQIFSRKKSCQNRMQKNMENAMNIDENCKRKKKIFGGCLK